MGSSQVDSHSGSVGCRASGVLKRDSYGSSVDLKGRMFGSGGVKSRAAALLELAGASIRVRLVAADGRRCGKRTREWSRMLPSQLLPKFLAFEFSSLRFGLPAFGGFLLFEHFGIPERFPLGELLPRDGFPGTLAPDFIILLHSTLRPRLGWNTLPASVGLLLLAASFGPLFVGQLKPGTTAFDSVGGTLDA